MAARLELILVTPKCPKNNFLEKKNAQRSLEDSNTLHPLGILELRFSNRLQSPNVCTTGAPGKLEWIGTRSRNQLGKYIPPIQPFPQHRIDEELRKKSANNPQSKSIASREMQDRLGIGIVPIESRPRHGRFIASGHPPPRRSFLSLLLFTQSKDDQQTPSLIQTHLLHNYSPKPQLKKTNPPELTTTRY
jgi:hypothetical protein